ncbi:hypothetical protein TTHERM_000316723 (macronuclear) [Tetrahymena thermophila SB210]|uniref:Uncharacterized protein n=1 Tax=Tetrahymena thermophila (strain SB210) TaxID=312017 RepID=W7X1G1_TETTS|nr:hypothetical protein TTHERM_000316723 [Tetrahymena thermophila SB210]EWS73080.1 hypothetical protein TTHERM_000316723 [Tetrahymena thermophila SB210]|eukprot:XP_012654389.1 hypothetical protein TTHERM_000316723 [Tetrahymena thermophila SB210]
MDIFSQVPVVSGFLLQEVSRYLMHSVEFLKIPEASFLRQDELQGYKTSLRVLTWVKCENICYPIYPAIEKSGLFSTKFFERLIAARVHICANQIKKQVAGHQIQYSRH